MKTKNTTTPPTRKSINRSPLRLGFILITLALASFAASPGAQAISPAPDGCYPNFTTAEGCNALNALSTGAGNTGLVGVRSFQSAPATSTPVLGRERCSSTRVITIPQLAQ